MRESARYLREEIIVAVKTCSPAFFEELVIDLLVRMGYGGSRREAGEILGRSGDKGIDGIIEEDRLGLDTIYVQAKRWENVAAVPRSRSSLVRSSGRRLTRGYSSRRRRFLARRENTRSTWKTKSS